MNTKQHDVYADYEVVIGIEVHTQLKTNTKIFCACSNLKDEQTEPNSSVCSICTGHPGVLPVLNEAVIAYAVKAGIATNSDIAPISHFDRKHYFYPDLPKGYQITQQRIPICQHGHVPIRLEDGTIKKIRLSRIHIEEDAGKNIHSSHSNESFVDLNRAGTPLLEIVTLPDISSAFEARAYLKMLHQIVKTIDICSGNMEEGAFRADTNISVRKKGEQKLGTKCELKNINSFKFISDAIEYEIKRQIDLLESGQKVKQETRLWDTKNKVTVVMRSKEEAADYRYFEEPDLPPIYVSDAYRADVKATMPELPYEKFDRLCADYGLTPYEATIFVDDPELADYFETAGKHTASKLLANWVLRDVVTIAKEEKKGYQQLRMTPKRLADILNLLEQNKITSVIAKELFEKVNNEDKDPEIILKTMDIKAPVSEDELEKMVIEIVDMYQEQKETYLSGKTKLLGFFVGKVLEKSKGGANPAEVTAKVKKILG